jgi:hypothetical protein
MFVEPALHRFENMLMFPAGDPAVYCRCATALERAGPAGVGPIAAQSQPVFDVGVVVLQPLAGRTAIDVLLRQIDEAGAWPRSKCCVTSCSLIEITAWATMTCSRQPRFALKM